MRITVLMFRNVFAQESVIEIAISEKEVESIKEKYKNIRGTHLTHTKTREC